MSATMNGTMMSLGGSQVDELKTDAELQAFLQLTSIEDKAMSLALERERTQNEVRLSAIERVNNFFIDEAHTREANIAEAQFLVDEQGKEKGLLISRQKIEAMDLKEEEEDKSMLDKLILEFRALKLKVRVREEAAEKVKSAKRRAQEKRNEFALRIKYLEARQERERRALADSHVRMVKNMSIFRNLLIDNDMSLKRLVSAEEAANGSSPTSAPSSAPESTTLKIDADRLHEAKMLQVKVRQQKEVEQLREEQLLRVKHINKLSEIEIDQTEEWETLLAEQKVQDMEMEADHVKEIETEQFRIQQQLNSLKAYNATRIQQHKASELAHQQKGEAKQLIKQHRLSAKYRKKSFFEREEALKAMELGDEKAAAEGGNTGGDGDAHSEGSGGSSDSRSDGGISKQTSEAYTVDTSTTSSGSEALSNATTDLMLEAQRAEEEESQKGRQQIEQLMMRQRELRESLLQQHREQRDALKMDHRQAMSDFHAEQEAEYQAVKRQQAIEMEQLMQLQKSADDMEEDNKVSNNLLGSMLPRFVSEALKLGKEVKPVDLNNITVLCTDIVQFTALTSKSSSYQIVNLLNRMYTAFDTILDDYKDVTKMETVGDAYILCGGLNTAANDAAQKAEGAEDVAKDSEHLSARLHAIEMAECAFRFVKAVEDLDMSDQVESSIKIRVGIHSGTAVGGVAGLVMPRFALFGSAPAISAQMEQKSQPNRIHVSAATAELLKKDYVLEPRAEQIMLEGGIPMQTYWLVGKKTAAGPSKGGVVGGAHGRRARGASAGTAPTRKAAGKTVRMAD
ncbi:hypothetical protein AMAG_01768 [Allomyces macrogynus ATCC 38327]|uniref:Guanylate cyclase domain-containing protein n=1 Tax=Allomyces macrogynus (strain ATCC 38327) TaxID=578462 RepID=A0A0L0S0N6_ALLM3|nr:hypothetical protein, variant [Allomyces macrogynus ATCC 38327]KNE55909.1 hypothetical protein AMAG_01768 [Allomyces macrogynus ATCC 38327]|eukprot:KNE55908.1 hypothetical protein, variant [Allomyces macrogynus ATCC 38327]